MNESEREEGLVDDPGVELRPIAEQIMLLEERHKRMTRGKEKFAVAKVIQRARDDFVRAFNRHDCWEEYRWPDGLTVRFVGPSESGGKARGRLRPIFSR